MFSEDSPHAENKKIIEFFLFFSCQLVHHVFYSLHTMLQSTAMIHQQSLSGLMLPMAERGETKYG